MMLKGYNGLGTGQFLLRNESDKMIQFLPRPQSVQSVVYLQLIKLISLYWKSNSTMLSISDTGSVFSNFDYILL